MRTDRKLHYAEENPYTGDLSFARMCEPGFLRTKCFVNLITKWFPSTVLKCVPTSQSGVLYTLKVSINYCRPCLPAFVFIFVDVLTDIPVCRFPVVSKKVRRHTLPPQTLSCTRELSKMPGHPSSASNQVRQEVKHIYSEGGRKLVTTFFIIITSRSSFKISLFYWIPIVLVNIFNIISCV